MSKNLYLVFLGIYILIIFVNYNSLNNPKPYPPKKIREEFKRGRERFSSYKYRGLSHYALPRLVKSESNWTNGNIYWNKSGIKLGIIGIIITLITMILGEVFNLYNYFTGIFIILIPSILGMILICYRMEKNILKD
ncbi:hypothetical protein [Microaceticoccus formicicus]|uniref:hypothetical protein n=1 Tax=Microaceticoccus formicicus TaxID=3118105 RepID=UPI003CD017A5|nr:hypothetical protein VZL98_10225 [Peptoniphilaceae bacterium AMB_02]